MSTPTSRLGRVIAWCAGLLLLHLALTSAYVSVVGPRHKAARSDQLWFEAPQQLDLVFLGDSHPRSAINPKIMGPTWVNLATGGEHYTKSYYRLRTLYELQPRQVRARTAARIQHRLSRCLQLPPKDLDVLTTVIELRPPACHQAVMPGACALLVLVSDGHGARSAFQPNGRLRLRLDLAADRSVS